jgi:tRNA pseudouridine38-40 synthase
VQGELETAVLATVQQPVNLFGASRTDSGVHALGQVAQFDAATRIPVERLADAINSRLPEDAEVLSAEVAPPDFDAISGARSKQYRYRILCTRRRALHLRKYVYRCWWDLDLAKMNEAAALLMGEHDFSSFCAAGSPRQSNVRTVHNCAVESAPDLSQLHIVISGNGFLYNMVRIIAGTLVEVGRGMMPVAQVAQALAENNRRLSGPTLPAEGLWLEWIKYDLRPPEVK